MNRTASVVRMQLVNRQTFIGLPMLIFFILIMWVFSRMQGGRGGMFGFGNSKAKMLNKEEPTNTFEDVAGCNVTLPRNADTSCSGEPLACK